MPFAFPALLKRSGERPAGVKRAAYGGGVRGVSRIRRSEYDRALRIQKNRAFVARELARCRRSLRGLRCVLLLCQNLVFQMFPLLHPGSDLRLQLPLLLLQLGNIPRCRLGVKVRFAKTRLELRKL